MPEKMNAEAPVFLTGARMNYQKITANYTATTLDYYVEDGGSHTITLPAAAAVGSGFTLVIIASGGTPTVTIAPNGTDNINGANSNVTIGTQYRQRTFVSDGVSNWYTTLLPLS